MQQTNISTYIGKGLELTAAVKAKDVKQWAGLWARLDDKNMKVLWFDNMQDTPIKGTTGWKQVSIKFKILVESVTLSFGVLLVRPGNVWINDFHLYELANRQKKPVSDLDIILTF